MELDAPPHLPPLPPAPDQDATLTATVRASASHATIAGARVQILALVEGRAYLAGSGTTSQAGTVRLEHLPRGNVWLLADAPGMARGTSQLVLEAGPRSLVVELGPGHHLEVAVDDDRGAPVGGAEIEVAGADPLPVGARTGNNGKVAIDRLGDAPWIVTARAPGFEQAVQRSVRDGTVRLTVRKLGAITVHVVDARDEPAPRAHVQIAGTELWPARVTDADEHGKVRIGSLGAGSYALRATQDEQASPIELGFLLERGEEKELTLHLAAGRMVGVRVVDGDGEGAPPVAGAHVSLAESGLSPFPLEASTDAAGGARLGPVAPGMASLGVSAPGFVAASRAVDSSERGPIVVGLVKAGTLEGRVVDARGFPVDGATIEVVGNDPLGGPIDDDPRTVSFRDSHFAASLGGPRPLIVSGERGVVPGPVPPIPQFFSSPIPTASPFPPEEPWVTRADGSFRIGPVSPGRVRALVRHPQFVEASSDIVTLAPGRGAHVDIVMHAGGSLEGRVEDRAGHGVAGVRVVVAAVRGSTSKSTRTSSDGTFAFSALPDTVTLTATAEDGGAARTTVTVAEGSTREVTLTLPEARLALGARVTDDRGYPVDAAQITVASLDPPSPLRVTAFTNAHGEASLPGARGLPLRVEVRAPGHATRIVSTDATLASLEVTLGVAASASGEVRAARGGDPIADAEVVLYTDVGVHRAHTDHNGSYNLPDLATGSARLRVRAHGYATSTRDVVVESLASHPTSFARTELAEEAVVAGVVVDGRGDPVPFARVARDQVPTYLAVGATPAGIVVTDAHGRFRLGELPEGSLTIEAYLPDLGRASADGVRTVAGRTTDGVKLVLGGGSGERSADPGASGGVAVTLGESDGEPPAVVLVAVAERSEAERAGLLAGDEVLAVDGRAVHTIAEARARLSGPLSDDVVVLIRRGEREESVGVPREPVRR